MVAQGNTGYAVRRGKISENLAISYSISTFSDTIWSMDPSMKQELEQLAEVSLFKDLSLDELQTVRALARIRSLGEDDFFFLQGDPADHLFVLCKGRVKLTQINADGQQILLRIITPWTLFAAIALVGKDSPYPVSAQSAEESSALVWSRVEISKMLEKMPRLALNAMQALAGFVVEFQDRYRELATERVERRLARALLRLVTQSGRKTSEGVLIDLPLSRQDLAEMTGTTLYTVSRILSQWESRQLIVSGRERVVVCNPHGLVKIAEDLP
jgi:CRP/FNR family transcriptional regulator, nitrogen oxide reductase regulator